MLTAGRYRVVITPPIGIGMVGFAGRGPSEGVHDDLTATALALSDSERGLMLVALDLLYLPAGLVAQIRAAVGERTDLPPDAIPCLSIQGAAGNINPVQMEHRYEPARRLGTILGAAVIQAYEEAAPEPAEIVATLRSDLELPAMSVSSVEEGRKSIAALEAEHQRLTDAGAAAGSLWWCERRLQRARAMLESREGGQAQPPVPAEVSAFHIGPVAAVPGPA